MFNSNKITEIKNIYKFFININVLSWLKINNKYYAKLIIPHNINDIKHILSQKLYSAKNIIGRGSNLIIKNRHLNLILIKLSKYFNYFYKHENTIVAGAGALDIDVSNFAGSNFISGLEFLSSIPGTIGGAIAMNAGSYCVDVKKSLIGAKAINLHNGKIYIFNKDELEMKYRYNDLSKNWLFLEGKFKGIENNKLSINNIVKEIQVRKVLLQPIKSRNIGSIFKNLHNYKIGNILEMCALKGVCCGDIYFSKLHCNFLINYKSAKILEFIFLIKIAKIRVKNKFNINLKEELKII